MSRARDNASGIMSGNIIQVVNLENSARTSQSYASNTVLDISNMSLTITPKKSNSKILIQMRWYGEMSPADTVYNSIFGLSRNGTQIGRQEGTSTVTSGLTIGALSYEGTDTNSTAETANYFYVDTPNLSSPLVYKVTFISTNAGTITTNQTIGWSNQTGGYELGTSSMIAMEIAQ